MKLPLGYSVTSPSPGGSGTEMFTTVSGPGPLLLASDTSSGWGAELLGLKGLPKGA